MKLFDNGHSPSWVLQYVPLDDRWYDGTIVAHTNVGSKQLVLLH